MEYWSQKNVIYLKNVKVLIQYDSPYNFDFNFSIVYKNKNEKEKLVYGLKN